MKLKKNAFQWIGVILLFLVILILLFMFEKYILKPTVHKEGYNNPTPVFFNKDDPNDEVATPDERAQEQRRVDDAVNKYFNGRVHLDDINSYAGRGTAYAAYGMDELHARMNYLQHSVDELRTITVQMGRRMIAGNMKLH